MGYTNYWKMKTKPGLHTWNRFLKDVNQVIFDLPKNTYQAGRYLTNEPLAIEYVYFDEAKLCFNGCKPHDCEDFVLKRQKTEFDFCKTNHNPYDFLVTATLMLAEKHFEGFSWSSDGSEKDYEHSRKFLEDKNLIDRKPRRSIQKFTVFLTDSTLYEFYIAGDELSNETISSFQKAMDVAENPVTVYKSIEEYLRARDYEIFSDFNHYSFSQGDL